MGALIGALAGGGRGAAMGAASGGALVTGVNAVTRGNEIIVRPEQLLQLRMNQAALVPVTLKDGHQVPPVPARVVSRRGGLGAVRITRKERVSARHL